MKNKKSKEETTKSQLIQIFSPDWKKMLFKKEHHVQKTKDKHLISDLESQRDMLTRNFNNLIKAIYLNDKKEMYKQVQMLNYQVTLLEEKFFQVPDLKRHNEYVLKIGKWSKK